MKLLLPFLFSTLVACSTPNPPTPPEIGAVRWQTDHDKALAEASRTGKPVFLLFQEVPG
ncbi:hypothetical protein GCM10007100_37840 [Roseibacillus persicicus]|uniref:Thioredoxin family protein n=2 Tax=Roseibacillus persicicus TaxID=454148 RepID=A0A918WNT1_9BACT|nr:hypothetical protein GCM10007100_37840 [Roseibacillus persicicus]